MLDQLVESSSIYQGNARRGGFLLTTLVLVVSLFFSAMLYSLFAKDYGMGGGDLELSSLVAPVPVPEEEPPPPTPEQPKPKEVKAAPSADVRKEIILAMNETPKVPDKISTDKNNIPERRPENKTVIGPDNLNSKAPAPRDYIGTVNPNNKGISGTSGNSNDADTEVDIPPPPVKKETPTPTPAQKLAPRSIGVVNGKAVRLVQPPYPPAAKAIRAAGAVNVSVSIDVNGNVTSANAVSGHALLKQAAEQAARGSKFSPTVLNGVPVPVTGIIIYNFIAQ